MKFFKRVIALFVILMAILIIIDFHKTVTNLWSRVSTVTETLFEHRMTNKAAEKSLENLNIQIGTTKNELEQQLGTEQSHSANEYLTQWHTYHQDYQNFFMVSYDSQDKVNGWYTNQESFVHQLYENKQAVHDTLGTPLSAILKGRTNFIIENNGEYDVYRTDDAFLTIFYDTQQKDTVTAIQVIEQSLELQKNWLYTVESPDLIQGFKQQLFDLTNADRVKQGFSILKQSDQVAETARKHSVDMAQHHYFAHDNLQGQSPFDRMSADGLTYTQAGENLAYGQPSAIFANEGLMNSPGHRENILHPDFTHLGIGVAFNTENQPYFTENFFR